MNGKKVRAAFVIAMTLIGVYGFSILPGIAFSESVIAVLFGKIFTDGYSTKKIFNNTTIPGLSRGMYVFIVVFFIICTMSFLLLPALAMKNWWGVFISGLLMVAMSRKKKQ